MTITREEVLYIARLARLELTPEDIERFTVQLNTILEQVAELQQVDVSAVDTLETVLDWAAPQRADEAAVDPLQLSPAQLSDHFTAGFFTVPRLAAMNGDS